MNDSSPTPDREQLKEYRRLQTEMAKRVLEVPLQKEPQVIAAVDVHLRGDRGVAVAVAVSYPGLETIEEQVAFADITFPYIPGLLSFREAPLCLDALRSLRHQPDLILVDGQGRAHPRRFGIACHVGVELDIPTFGVAKSILTGCYESLGSQRGSTATMVTRGEIVGMAVRTRTGVSPVYVSVGNLITLEEAVNWTLNAVQKVRLPEPSRRAHRTAQRLARELR